MLAQPSAAMAHDNESSDSRLTRSPAQPTSSIFSSRAAKQLGLFFAGAGFFCFSAMVTRRAVARKQLAAFPKFYQPSHYEAGKQGNPEGSMIALEALNLATLNVCSFAMMMTGGAAWAFDITSVQDLRDMARRSIHGAAGQTDEAAEREFEEWAAKVLTKFGQAPPVDGGKESQNKTEADTKTGKEGR
ncbi:hypothetical protein CPLU01_03370 [Colletotrichum plurivorum]|uniref:Altered inheritance of mitochondria protein 11 n=1 Tax=Colletotrichum plurivorum TaxID=2175906 RepID=A0A8H6KTJ1_9PEZI|nr:hypothetical protein CPLU01_03370 [Colletotrichum plurivorum]